MIKNHTIKDLEHKVDVLPNGLTVVRVPMPSVASVTVVVLVNIGSRYETPAQLGMAHFLEHMVFKGTNKYPSTQAISTTIDAVGADFNAFTSKEYTGYYVKSASRHMAMAVDVISDMLLTPLLKQDDIDRERNVIVEEMRMYQDLPTRHIGDVFENALFKGTSLGHDVIGLQETVMNFKSGQFQAFLDEWYGLDNVVVTVAGDAEVVSRHDTLEMIEEAFSKSHAARKPKPNREKWFSKTLETAGELNITVEKKKTEQAHLVFGMPGINRHDPRRYAINLMSTILGGNMSSRLFEEVREKRGLCYYVHSELDYYHDLGMVGASAGVDPSRIQEALEVIWSEFGSVVSGKKPITSAELNRAQEYAMGKLVLSLEDSEQVAQYYGFKQLLFGKIETPSTVVKKFKAVTTEQVNSLAKEFLSGQPTFAVIGPFEDDQIFKSILSKKS